MRLDWAPVLNCPFCGAPETDRLNIAGARFLVFGCMFTPRVDPDLSDAEVAERLHAVGTDPGQYFRGTCDALHVYVTKGEGARFLTGPGGKEPHARPESPENTM
jgi:hypothetical protein